MAKVFFTLPRLNATLRYKILRDQISISLKKFLPPAPVACCVYVANIDCGVCGWRFFRTGRSMSIWISSSAGPDTARKFLPISPEITQMRSSRPNPAVCHPKHVTVCKLNSTIRGRLYVSARHHIGLTRVSLLVHLAYAIVRKLCQMIETKVGVIKNWLEVFCPKIWEAKKRSNFGTISDNFRLRNFYHGLPQKLVFVNKKNRATGWGVNPRTKASKRLLEKVVILLPWTRLAWRRLQNSHILPAYNNKQCRRAFWGYQQWRS